MWFFTDAVVSENDSFLEKGGVLVLIKKKKKQSLSTSEYIYVLLLAARGLFSENNGFY